MNRSVSHIAEQVKVKGYISISNFLNQEDLSLAEKILSHKQIKGKESSFPIFPNQYLVKLLRMDLSKIKKSLILKKIAQNLQLEAIAENIFEDKAELHMIDSYYSERSEDHIASWHNDLGLRDTDPKETFYDVSSATVENKKSKVSSRGIKFFIYMTDVQSDNGALAVIPYSNQIVKAMTQLILEKKIELKPYWSLKDLRDFVAEDKTKKLISKKIGSEIVEKFLMNSNFINEQEKDSKNYDLEMNKGGVVIFDELCVHRGSAPKKNSRIVLRYLYRKR